MAATVNVFGASELNAEQRQSSIQLPSQRTKALMSHFGLRYPIFQAPTSSVAGPELAIAVSNAGAMGAMGTTWHTPEAARDDVSKVRASTKRMFAVNYVLAFEPKSLPAALEAGAPVVQFSFGIPTREILSQVRASGAKLGMQVTSAESARAALDLGADYLVCQGTEAGGHVQGTRSLYDALPGVLEEAKQTPVVASGGIGNGQAIRKALLAGASAAMLGTRFVASKESFAHPEYKSSIVQAHAQDTALTTCFSDGWPNALHRVLRNRTFVMWDAAGCPPLGKRPGEGDVIATTLNGTKVIRYSDLMALRGFEGAVTECPQYAGSGVDTIKDLPAAGELVERLWKECQSG
jgi:nitronate monooxygenase